MSVKYRLAREDCWCRWCRPSSRKGRRYFRRLHHKRMRKALGRLPD